MADEPLFPTTRAMVRAAQEQMQRHAAAVLATQDIDLRLFMQCARAIQQEWQMLESAKDAQFALEVCQRYLAALRARQAD